MMKHISLILILAMIFAGCHKETESVFDKSVDERLSDALTSYQDKLTQQPGWKVFVYPKGLTSQGIEVGGFSYYMKFTDSNRVTMVSDFDLDMAGTPKESGFRLKAVQRPSIYFDTYSYIHIPADPTFNVNFSPTFYDGYGWGSDFDFAFADNAPSDTIHLKGNFNNSEAVMIKASQAEIDSAFKKGKLRAVLDSTVNYIDRSPYLYIPGLANLKVGLAFDFYYKFITFFYIAGNGSFITVNSPFTATVNGIYLKDPVTVAGYTFQELFWDNAKSVYYIMVNGKRVELLNNPTPVTTFSLANIIGSSYTTITVPNPLLPNQSATFTAKYNAVKTAIKNGSYNLDLSNIDFVFNAASKTMFMNVYVYQGTGLYLAQFAFSYTTDNAGVFKFTRTGQNGNGGLIEADMRSLLDYFEGDNFNLQGQLTTAGLLAQFTSVQHPDFYFSGYLN